MQAEHTVIALDSAVARADSANRITAAFGMAFGGTLALAVLVVAATVGHPRGIQIDSYDQVALMLTGPLGKSGLYLFAASLGIACFGAASEIALTSGYMMAQEFGWNWSEDLPPHRDARVAMVYTVAVMLAAIPMLLGVATHVVARVACLITDSMVGDYALAERLAIGPVMRSLIRDLPWSYVSYRIPWDRMDLADLARPRTTCAKDDLPRAD